MKFGQFGPLKMRPPERRQINLISVGTVFGVMQGGTTGDEKSRRGVVGGGGKEGRKEW